MLLRASAEFISEAHEDFVLHVDVQDTGVYYLSPHNLPQFDAFTGIGISSKAAAGLFKPFVQADQSMTRRFGGSGLGLSIAQQLSHLMGGKIWCGSLIYISSTDLHST